MNDRTAEILKKVQQIEIRTRHLVNSIFSGEYHSTFQGEGMEFAEVREYCPGDDIRSIDWNVTARFGHPYIKKYIEERELTVMLMVDASSSGDFGTVDKTKNEIAAEVCALLAFSAIKNNDKVGLLIFTDTVEKFIPPQKGKRHVLRVIREVLSFRPQHKKTNIDNAIQYFTRIMKRRSIAFLISDFIDEGFRKSLQIASKKHDVIAVSITDPREISLPDAGIVEFEDTETGEIIVVDTSSREFRKMFEKESSKTTREIETMFRQISVDHISLNCGTPYILPILSFFKKRESMKGM